MDPIEEERCKKLLGGKRVEDWQDRPLEALVDGINMTQLQFISAAAYQYYLPLYMLTAAYHWDECGNLPDELISSFTRDSDPMLNKRFFVDRFQDFTPKQLKAILSFLAYIQEEQYQETNLKGEREDVDRAVESIKSLLQED